MGVHLKPNATLPGPAPIKPVPAEKTKSPKQPPKSKLVNVINNHLAKQGKPPLKPKPITGDPAIVPSNQTHLAAYHEQMKKNVKDAVKKKDENFKPHPYIAPAMRSDDKQQAQKSKPVPHTEDNVDHTHPELKNLPKKNKTVQFVSKTKKNQALPKKTNPIASKSFQSKKVGKVIPNKFSMKQLEVLTMVPLSLKQQMDKAHKQQGTDPDKKGWLHQLKEKYNGQLK